MILQIKFRYVVYFSTCVFLYIKKKKNTFRNFKIKYYLYKKIIKVVKITYTKDMVS